jgi:hypothetical protein
MDAWRSRRLASPKPEVNEALPQSQAAPFALERPGDEGDRVAPAPPATPPKPETRVDSERVALAPPTGPTSSNGSGNGAPLLRDAVDDWLEMPPVLVNPEDFRRELPLFSSYSVAPGPEPETPEPEVEPDVLEVVRLEETVRIEETVRVVETSQAVRSSFPAEARGPTVGSASKATKDTSAIGESASAIGESARAEGESARPADERAGADGEHPGAEGESASVSVQSTTVVLESRSSSGAHVPAGAESSSREAKGVSVAAPELGPPSQAGAASAAARPPSPRAGQPPSSTDLKEFWRRLMHDVKERDIRLHAVLSDAKLATIEESTFEIALPPGYEWHRDKLQEGRKLLETVAAGLAGGRRLSLECTLGGEKASPPKDSEHDDMVARAAGVFGGASIVE